MDRDTVIRWANEIAAQRGPGGGGGSVWLGGVELIQFADLVLEEAAKACDVVHDENCYEGSQAADCGRRIRALKSEAK